MRYKCKTPVLLIAFNRPDTLDDVFEAVRSVQPSFLYVAIDGAREGKPGEAEKCNECKKVIDRIDWSCQLQTLYRKENVGCGRGPSEAISWAFETTDRLIILEDDCVPNQSFFRFCDEMLERYKDDERVWLVSGRSHQSKSPYFKNQDYIFSHYAHTWGWATWKRCWQEFDLRMRDTKEFIAMGGARNVLATKEQGDFYNKWFMETFNRIDREVTHSWDFQWVYTYMKNGGLGIVPCKNLVKNIGGGNGTHTGKNATTLDLPTGELPDILRHPQFVIMNEGYESLHFRTHIRGNEKGVLIRILKKIKILIWKKQ